MCQAFIDKSKANSHKVATEKTAHRVSENHHFLHLHLPRYRSASAPFTKSICLDWWFDDEYARPHTLYYFSSVSRPVRLGLGAWGLKLGAATAAAVVAYYIATAS